MIEAIHNALGERIDFSFAPAARDGADLVVIGHGVTANKDRPWAVTLATTLEAAGYATLRISFSGNGESDGTFEASTITKEVGDLGSVLDACERAGTDRVCYVGHSMGAAVGMIRATEDARIARLVSLGGMVSTADFVQRKFADLTPGRDVMWEKPDCPLSQAYVDDLTALGSLVDLGALISVPFLLVHGTDDTVVPVLDSRALAARAPRANLVELPGADHVFTGDYAAVMAATVRDWMRTTD